MEKPDRRGTDSTKRVDAALFAMDGVITDTAQAHAAAWKRLFDEYLSERAAGTPYCFRGESAFQVCTMFFDTSAEISSSPIDSKVLKTSAVCSPRTGGPMRSSCVVSDTRICLATVARLPPGSFPDFATTSGQ